MKNRLIEKIGEAKRGRTKLFCAFLTLGYPNLSATEQLITEFERIGVDIVELGFPFSDPLADGPTIQFSSERALARGVCLQDAFRLCLRLRRKGVKIPIVFFSYLNPIYHYGAKDFVTRAKAAGFDGVIVPDLPPEEEPAFRRASRRQGLAQVFLIAPTTERKRALQIARASRGFIYYVSLRGVTGARKALPADLRRNLVAIKRIVKKPVLIGFGVSGPGQARTLAGLSDGVIVGSAIVDRLKSGFGRIQPAVRFVQQMVRAAKSVRAMRSV